MRFRSLPFLVLVFIFTQSSLARDACWNHKRSILDYLGCLSAQASWGSSDSDGGAFWDSWSFWGDSAEFHQELYDGHNSFTPSGSASDQIVSDKPLLRKHELDDLLESYEEPVILYFDKVFFGYTAVHYNGSELSGVWVSANQLCASDNHYFHATHFDAERALHERYKIPEVRGYEELPRGLATEYLELVGVYWSNRWCRSGNCAMKKYDGAEDIAIYSSKEDYHNQENALFEGALIIPQCDFARPE